MDIRNYETKVLQEEQVGSAINGTGLRGYLHGYSYERLVEALGEPTYTTASGDDKVQKEWVLRFERDGRYVYATLYDWKTYDAYHTCHILSTWNIGGRDSMTASLVKEYVDMKLQDHE